MHKDSDAVDRALQSLAGQQWPGDSYDVQLERKLMQSYETNKPVLAFYRHRLLIPALALVLIASVSFVSFGGVALVKSWFVTTTINGQVVDVREVVPKDDGSVSFNVPIGEVKSGGNVVELSFEGDGAPADVQTTFNVTLTGDEAQVEMTPDPNGSGE
jgi:hypothetical protein